MISFDSKAGGRYELNGSGEDLAKDYIGITIALGRSMIDSGVPLPEVRETMSTLAAQGITLIEMPQPEKKEESTNKLIDFVTGGENADV